MVLNIKNCFAILLLLFIITLLTFFSLTREKKEIVKANIVKNNTDYYDVINVVNKFVSYKSKNELLGMLDKKFISDNKINKNNIYDYVENFSEKNYYFNVLDMYYNKRSKILYDYYIYGTLNQASMQSNSNGKDYYLKIILDNKNSTFSVTPIDKAVYMEVTR